MTTIELNLFQLFNLLPNTTCIIIGKRSTGKTTLMLQRAKELQKNHLVLYTSLDLPYFYTNSIFDLADTFYKSGGNYLFLDEIHKYQNWSQELKNIRDKIKELKSNFPVVEALNIIYDLLNSH